uniref:IRG-type G domain-containing protein n=1 Tax=Terrapene triunguis TaxID=2587831 RepID=A0A674IS32_9SAUR
MEVLPRFPVDLLRSAGWEKPQQADWELLTIPSTSWKSSSFFKEILWLPLEKILTLLWDFTCHTLSGPFCPQKSRGIPEGDMEVLKAAVGEGNLIKAAAKAKEALEMVDKITVNIAVTGQAGSGISSFVNAIRGLKDRDKGAAAIGVTETTIEPTPYRHPEYPNVTVWDLPGIGTPDFKSHTYLEKMEFSRYDFFIIISNPRLTYHDISLAQKIQRQRKKFYFVRSKGTLKQSNAPNYIKGLEAGGVASSRVFLVSKWYLGKYDFPKLQETLVDELPSHKRRAVLRSLCDKAPQGPQCLTLSAGSSGNGYFRPQPRAGSWQSPLNSSLGNDRERHQQ